jgi:hypothetical protein
MTLISAHTNLFFFISSLTSSTNFLGGSIIFPLGFLIIGLGSSIIGLGGS